MFPIPYFDMTSIKCIFYFFLLTLGLVFSFLFFSFLFCLESFFDHHFTTKKEKRKRKKKSGLACKEIQPTSQTKETQVAKYSLEMEYLV
jgi:hypothetical protein